MSLETKNDSKYQMVTYRNIDPFDDFVFCHKKSELVGWQAEFLCVTECVWAC